MKKLIKKLIEDIYNLSQETPEERKFRYIFKVRAAELYNKLLDLQEDVENYKLVVELSKFSLDESPKNWDEDDYVDNHSVQWQDKYRPDVDRIGVLSNFYVEVTENTHANANDDDTEYVHVTFSVSKLDSDLHVKYIEALIRENVFRYIDHGPSCTFYFDKALDKYPDLWKVMDDLNIILGGIWLKVKKNLQM